MRLGKLAVLACLTFIFLAHSQAASAGVITYSQTLHVSTGSLDGRAFILALPDFNTKLGTLTQISLQFTGTVFDQVVFEEGSPEGGTFVAANNAQLLAGGFSPQTLYSLADGCFMFSAGTASAYSTTTQAAFTAFVADAALPQYTTGLPPGYESTVLNFGFTLLDADGKRVGGVSDGETTFDGQVLESYTYTAVSVLEPGTLTLAVSGIVAFGALRRRSGVWQEEARPSFLKKRSKKLLS